MFENAQEDIVLLGGKAKDRGGNNLPSHMAVLMTFESLQIIYSFHPWSLLWGQIHQHPHLHLTFRSARSRVHVYNIFRKDLSLMVTL